MSGWSKPYHGVQHLDGVKPGWQVTVEDHFSWAEVYVLQGLHSVSESQHATAATARVWGEEQAKRLGVL